jgi:hypothetical protein
MTTKWTIEREDKTYIILGTAYYIILILTILFLLWDNFAYGDKDAPQTVERFRDGTVNILFFFNNFRIFYFYTLYIQKYLVYSKNLVGVRIFIFGIWNILGNVLLYVYTNFSTQQDTNNYKMDFNGLFYFNFNYIYYCVVS